MTEMTALMNAPSRRIHGRVLITYFNPLFDVGVYIDYSSISYNSELSQVANNVYGDPYPYFFALFDNDLTGTYGVYGPLTEVGWASATLSDSNGEFSTPEWLHTEFAPKLLRGIEIVGDVGKNIYLVDFDVIIKTDNDEEYLIEVRDHNNIVYEFEQDIADVNYLTVIVYKVNKPYVPATITELGVSATIIYNDNDLISIDFMEELTYSDDVGELGTVSANEVTVKLNNTNGDFYFNNPASLIANQLKKNRRVEPSIGIEDNDGNIYWTKLGVFWSYKWTVPKGSLVATVVAFDSLGFLGNFTFTNHQVYKNTNMYTILTNIFVDIGTKASFITTDVSPELGSITIPYVWFENNSYLQALQKIAGSGLVDIYCDRNGTIVARPKVYDVGNGEYPLSETKNVISTTYPTLNNDPYNQIEVLVTTVTEEPDTTILSITQPFDVTEGTQTFYFGSPYLQDAIVTITGVPATYILYGWGMEVTFEGSGTVESIEVVATALHTEQSTSAFAINETDKLYEGEHSTIVSSDFIQSLSYAQTLADRLLDYSYSERYNAELDYRGNAELTINATAHLEESLAPSKDYLVTRHSLTYDGALRGKLRIRTGGD